MATIDANYVAALKAATEMREAAKAERIQAARMARAAQALAAFKGNETPLPSDTIVRPDTCPPRTDGQRERGTFTRKLADLITRELGDLALVPAIAAHCEDIARMATDETVADDEVMRLDVAGTCYYAARVSYALTWARGEHGLPTPTLTRLEVPAEDYRPLPAYGAPKTPRTLRGFADSAPTPEAREYARMSAKAKAARHSADAERELETARAAREAAAALLESLMAD